MIIHKRYEWWEGHRPSLKRTINGDQSEFLFTALMNRMAWSFPAPNYVRIQNRQKPDHYINIEPVLPTNPTPIDVLAHAAAYYISQDITKWTPNATPLGDMGWHSAQWVQVPIPNSDHFFLRNRWRKCYLRLTYSNVKTGEGRELECSAIPGTTVGGIWERAAQWKKEPTGGSGHFNLWNRWEIKQLHIEYGDIRLAPRQPLWHSAQWLFESDL